MSLRSLQELFGFDPGISRTRSALTLVGWLTLIIGGPLLGVGAMQRFPWLIGNRFWWGCAASIFCGALLWLLLMRGRWPPGIPLHMKIGASLGLSLSSLFFIFGSVAFANGTLSNVEIRDVDCVSKQHSRGERIEFYLYVKAWPGSDEIANIDVPQNVYNRVYPPAMVRLRLARGLFGIEWLEGVSLPDTPKLP